MRNAVAALSFHLVIPAAWRENWAWGLPLIVLTVVIHVLSLELINQRGARLLSQMTERRHPTLVFAVVMGTTTLLAMTTAKTSVGWRRSWAPRHCWPLACTR